MNDQAPYLAALELISWQSKFAAPAAETAIAEIPVTADPAVKPAAPAASLDALRQCVADCTACTLHATRTQTVFGVGNQQATLMVIGEAPGFHEDKQGEPFVGRAGQLLTAMLNSIGFSRDDVYIANILKCRPPENRDPTLEEVAKCTPFLNQQIALIQPRLLLAVGRVAAHYLLGSKQSLESLRNQIHSLGDSATPLIITYHPAYLLRSPSDKKKAYSDLLFTKKTLASLV
jgi:DNA polymerase